jgi:adenine-specific DNA-methyltransferase
LPTLHWLTRDQDLLAAQRVPYRLLEDVPDLSHDAAGSENLLVQGDNLEALKALLPFYAGQVKCIFIDPPYNTGAAFAHYDDNLEHATWLAMMWPRLVLLREFLAPEGSIWVTIDDNEAHYLKVVMDEVFGRTNFVGSCVWERDAGGRGDGSFSISHDFVLLYAKNKERWVGSMNLMQRTPTQAGRFRNPDADPRGPWRQGDDGTAKSGTEKQQFPVTLPSGRTVTPKKRFWAFSEENLIMARLEGRAYFGKKGNSMPIIKRYLSQVREGVAPRTWWPSEEVGTNQSAKRDHLNKLLPALSAFDTPKPESLVERTLQISSNPGDLVLDSFLGSGTTAAVAHKMGRRWIGIEMGEHARTHCVPRLQKVIAGEQGGISQAVNWRGGGGYRFLRLGETVFDETGKLRPNIPFAALAAHIWFAETRAPRPEPRGPLLGIHEGRAVALLYNGILGDKRPRGGNVLTHETLALIRAQLPKGFAGPLTIYGEQARLSAATLKAARIAFRQTPHALTERGKG